MDYCTQNHEVNWKLGKMDIEAFKKQLKRDGFLDEAISQITNAVNAHDDMCNAIRSMLITIEEGTFEINKVNHWEELNRALAKAEGK